MKCARTRGKKGDLEKERERRKGKGKEKRKGKGERERAKEGNVNECKMCRAFVKFLLKF